jgi:hypothetical protein
MSEKPLEQRQAEMRERMVGRKRVKPVSESVPRTEELEHPPDLDRSPLPTISRQNGKAIISRQDLYELLWTEPTVKVAARLGVSDVAVAKACRRNKIPLPGRGYWARVAAGQKMTRTALPDRKEARTEMLTFEGAQNTPASQVILLT